jgi:hypothetical protein
MSEWRTRSSVHHHKEMIKSSANALGEMFKSFANALGLFGTPYLSPCQILQLVRAWIYYLKDSISISISSPWYLSE